MKINYLKRIFSAYVFKRNSQLTFWHGRPFVNENAFPTDDQRLGQYYQSFEKKALYPGPFDEHGIPLLNYHGVIGKQYNPIAIIQFGLGNHDLYKQTGQEEYKHKFLNASEWLLKKLEKNSFGLWVWNHKFDWEYFQQLKNPWYSALAQGQGLSILARAYVETQDKIFLDASDKVFQTLISPISAGGVQFVDQAGGVWLEEYLVEPASHVLNGFIWAVWGVRDYYILTGSEAALNLYNQCLKTIKDNLPQFDIGFWSKYDASKNFLRTIASKFYHNLHIVQLEILFRLTGDDTFKRWQEKWQKYNRNKFYNALAFIYKVVFKVFYY